jgi:hypothetical protein
VADPVLTATFTGGHTSATSATVSSVTGAANTFYLVCVALRTAARTISSISYSGLTFTQIGTAKKSGGGLAGDEQFTLFLYGAYGTGTTGNLVVTYDTTAGTSSVIVCQITNANSSTPTGGFASNGAADTTALQLTVDSTATVSATGETRFFVFACPRTSQFSASPADASYTRSANADNGASGERVNLYLETLFKGSPGSDSWDGTSAGAVDWATVGLYVNPYEAPAASSDNLTLLGVDA